MGWSSDDHDSVDSGTDPSSAAASTSASMGGDDGGRDSGGGSDPSGMASFAAEASRATNGQVDAAAANAAVAAMDAGLSGGDGSGYQGAYTLPTINGMVTMPAPVERATPVSTVNPNYQPLTRDYTQADLDAAIKGFGEARDTAYADKQFGADFGMFKGPFGVYEGIYDAIFDPEAAMANALAERGARTFNGEAVPSSYGNYSERGLDLATAGGPLSQGGRVAGYDERGNIVFDTSPFSGLNPFGEGIPENIQALYDMRNQVEAEQRAMQSDGGDRPAALLVPEQTPEEERQQSAFPEFKPREYRYQPFTSKFYTIPSRFTRPMSLLG